MGREGPAAHQPAARNSRQSDERGKINLEKIVKTDRKLRQPRLQMFLLAPHTEGANNVRATVEIRVRRAYVACSRRAAVKLRGWWWWLAGEERTLPRELNPLSRQMLSPSFSASASRALGRDNEDKAVYIRNFARGGLGVLINF